MKPNQSKECLIKKDGQVQLVRPETMTSTVQDQNQFKKHLCAIYSLLILSFVLHLYVIINNAVVIDANEPQELNKERGRRSVEQRNVDAGK